MQASTETNNKSRVVLEADKVRQTTHWDLDYLPLQTVDSLYDRKASGTAETASPGMSSKTPSNRYLGMICILAGVGLLVMSLAVAGFVAN